HDRVDDRDVAVLGCRNLHDSRLDGLESVVVREREKPGERDDLAFADHVPVPVLDGDFDLQRLTHVHHLVLFEWVEDGTTRGRSGRLWEGINASASWVGAPTRAQERLTASMRNRLGGGTAHAFKWYGRGPCAPASDRTSRSSRLHSSRAGARGHRRR